MTHDKWSRHVIDAYKPLEAFGHLHTEDWSICPKCGEQPRIWWFDNGLNAKCCCSELFGIDQAKSESIMSYLKRNNGSSVGYLGTEDLRLRWNKYCETGIAQNILEEGQW